MVGIRVLDVGGLVAWLVWFSRQRGDQPNPGDDGDGGPGSPSPQWPPPVPGSAIPLPDGAPWPHRRRDHVGDREPVPPARRRAPRRAPVR